MRQLPAAAAALCLLAGCALAGAATAQIQPNPTFGAPPPPHPDIFKPAERKGFMPADPPKPAFQPPVPSSEAEARRARQQVPNDPFSPDGGIKRPRTAVPNDPFTPKD